MSRPRLLDLFCGAGGCSVGYHRAGFDVVGVDHVPQPHYPFEFVEADAIAFLDGRRMDEYEAIHASPPCQAYSRARHTPGSAGRDYPALLPEVRRHLVRIGLPYVIENVELAPMKGIVLCGTMFGLPLRRHRVFESSVLLLGPGNPCRHRPGDLTIFGNCVQITGSRGIAYTARSGRQHYRPLRTSTAEGAAAMGIDWMVRKDLSQAIPPAYAEFVGRQLLRVLEG